eukprot:IDg16684t1
MRGKSRYGCTTYLRRGRFFLKSLSSTQIVENKGRATAHQSARCARLHDGGLRTALGGAAVRSTVRQRQRKRGARGSFELELDLDGVEVDLKFVERVVREGDLHGEAVDALHGAMRTSLTASSGWSSATLRAA